MPKSNLEAVGHKSSNRKHLEVLDRSNTRIHNVLNEVTTTLVKLRMTFNGITCESEENRRAKDAMRCETNASLKRLKRMVVETNGQGPPPSLNMQGQDTFVDGAEANVIVSMYKPQRQVFRRGEKVENN